MSLDHLPAGIRDVTTTAASTSPPPALAPELRLNHAPRLPRRKDFRIGCAGAGFIMRDCHLVAYRTAGFHPTAIASRSRETADTVGRQHGIGKVHATLDELL